MKTTEIENKMFRNKKSGVTYLLSNIVRKLDGSIYHISGCLSGYQIKDGKIYGRVRTFFQHQVEQID
jgi:hypothetical protein